MDKTVTASRLRENIYSILDEVLETGTPVEIVRNGRILRIVPDQNNPPSKLDNLKKRDVIIGDPEELVHMDWSAEWSRDGIGTRPKVAAAAMKTMAAGGRK